MVGAALAAPTIDLSASNYLPSADLVEGRVGNLKGVNLRGSLNHFPQGLQHCWIGPAVIRFRVLFLIPQTDCDRFHSARDDERDFVLEAFLLSKQGNDFLLERLGKLGKAVGLDTHGHISSKHVNLLDWGSSVGGG